MSRLHNNISRLCLIVIRTPYKQRRIMRAFSSAMHRRPNVIRFTDNSAHFGETPFKKNCGSFTGFQETSYVIVFLFFSLDGLCNN